MNSIAELLKSETTVIDVRTPAEYIEGHLKGSINIPLDDIPQHLSDLKNHTGVIVCCASGFRSNKAAGILKQNGIECRDGGSWLNLNNLTTKNQ